jgi:hypothetical protein
MPKGARRSGEGRGYGTYLSIFIFAIPCAEAGIGSPVFIELFGLVELPGLAAEGLGTTRMMFIMPKSS